MRLLVVLVFERPVKVVVVRVALAKEEVLEHLPSISQAHAARHEGESADVPATIRSAGVAGAQAGAIVRGGGGTASAACVLAFLRYE